MTPKHPPQASKPTRLSGLEQLVLVLFFASGASALIYEVVWSRLLTYTFGGSAYAIATVLAAYMGGLALGSLWFGKRIDRKGHPLLVYGILEGIIGVWALLLPAVLSALDGLYASLYQATHLGFYPLSFIRFIFCFLLLLVPTTMMGGTLPVLGKLLLRNWRGLGARAGLLYGINTLGAVLGVFGAGFVVVPAVGLNGATYLAVLMNFTILAAAYFVSKRIPFRRNTGSPDGAVAPPAFRIPRDPLKRAVLVVYAASGFAALSYEVAWTKALSLVLGTTTYAFTSMLTTFLLGLAVGAFLFGRLADRFGRPERLLFWVQLAIPLFALLTIPIVEHLPQWWVNAFPDLQDSWVKIEAFRFALAAATMAVPALLMGATFPLVTRIFVERDSVGSSLGTLYASNTVGAILGSFLTGFVLVPWIGRQNSILTATLVNLLAAGALWAVMRRQPLPRKSRWVTVALLILLIPTGALALRPWNKKVMSSGAYYYPLRLGDAPTIQDHLKDSNLIFYQESTEAVISVWRTQHYTSLAFNGKVDASSHDDMITQKFLAHLPMVYHGCAADQAMVIGLASGVTAGSLLTYPVRQLDAVDLVKGVDQAAACFTRYNHDCIHDPRLNLIINDGRNQLRLSDKTYDVIVSEPPNPWIAGVGSLFTREFFQLAHKRLRPGGVMCAWLQLYQVREEEIKAVLATFSGVFEDVHLWMGNRGDLLMIGGREPLSVDWAAFTQAFQGDPGRDLGIEDLTLPVSLFSFFVTDDPGLHKLLGPDPNQVTDDNLLLEYAIPRHMFQRDTEMRPSSLVPFLTDPGPTLKGAPDSSRALARVYQRAHGTALQAAFDPQGTPRSRKTAAAQVLEIAPRELLARTMLAGELNTEGIALLQKEDLNQDDLDRARAVLHQSLDVAPRSEAALAWTNLGYIADAEGKSDSAEAFWTRAIDLEPDLFFAVYNLAMVAGRRGDHGRAAALYEKAADIEPTSSEAYNNAAYHLWREGETDKALPLARKAVALGREPENLDTLGSILIQQERYGEAEALLLEAVERRSDYDEAWLHLGEAQAKAGKTAESRQSLQRVVDRAQDPALVRQAQALLQSLSS